MLARPAYRPRVGPRSFQGPVPSMVQKKARLRLIVGIIVCIVVIIVILGLALGLGLGLGLRNKGVNMKNQFSL